MKCPVCHTDNPDINDSCHRCGSKLEQICPRCSSSNSPLYAFCGNCGYRLTPESVPLVETAESVPDTETPTPTPTAKPTEPPTIAKEKMMAYPRTPTGIEGLDRLIGGGLLTGKVYLVSGESGTGKTVFGLQYLYHGLLQGENGIYISGDEKANHLVVDARSLGWDLNTYIAERRLRLLDVAPYFADIRAGKKKELDVRSVVNDLTKYVKSISAKRVVIDPIAPLVFVPEHYAFVQEYVRDFIFAIEDNLGCTIVITADIISGTASLSKFGMEEFVSKGVIVLGMAMRDGKRVRTLTLKKMRSTPADIGDHVFEILPDLGIVIKD